MFNSTARKRERGSDSIVTHTHTPALNRSGWSASPSGRFVSWGRAHVTFWTAG